MSKYLIVLLGMLIIVGLEKIDSLKMKNSRLTNELKISKTSLSELSKQYVQIDQVLSIVAEEKRTTYEQVTTLQKELKQAQIGQGCTNVPVPNIVSDKLRERVTQANSSTITHP